MFIQAKRRNAANGGQFQVPDANLRRLTIFHCLSYIHQNEYIICRLSGQVLFTLLTMS